MRDPVHRPRRAPRAPSGRTARPRGPTGFLFTAGQVGFDPATGELVDGGIAEQTERVLENIRAILEAERLELGSVVKTTVFLVDMADFAAMNEVYARAFGDHRPARSTVAVAALPRGARVEIEAVARYYLPEPERERIGPGGLAGLQNRDGGAFGGSGEFDSHTLPPPAPARAL